MARSKASDGNTGRKGIDATLADLQKQFGAGSVVRMGDAPREKIKTISTGVINIDIALGRGGLPCGRVVEIYGPESSGKTTLALNVIAQAQKEGGLCAFIDAEHALDPEYAENLGVDIDSLILSQPDHGEQALQIANKLVDSGEISVIVIDSVAALTPLSEIEGEMGDANVGKQARMMSQALRKLTPTVQKNGTLLIFINQLREKIGVMFGNPETTTGGRALKFYSSVRLDVRSTPNIKQGDDVIGSTTKIKVVKNKVAPPFKTAEVKTYWGVGFSKSDAMLTAAMDYGIFEKAGAWVKYDDQSFRAADLEQRLAEDPAFMDQIGEKVRAIAFANVPTPVEEDEDLNVDPETGEILDEVVEQPKSKKTTKVEEDGTFDDGSIFDG